MSDEAETIINMLRYLRIEPSLDHLAAYIWLVHKQPRKYAEELWPYCKEFLKAPVPEWVREQPPAELVKLRMMLTTY